MAAALREVTEETSIVSARIVGEREAWLQYDFPTKVRTTLAPHALIGRLHPICPDSIGTSIRSHTPLADLHPDLSGQPAEPPLQPPISTHFAITRTVTIRELISIWMAGTSH